MPSNQHNELEERMRSLDDHALLRLVAVEAADYRPEALDIACKELRQRRLEALTREQYWDRFPAERVGPDGFCVTCRAQTTDEAPDTYRVNFLLGTLLIGHDDKCPSCGSVLQTEWLQFLLPIARLGTYRIIYPDRDIMSARYIGRRIKNDKNAAGSIFGGIRYILDPSKAAKAGRAPKKYRDTSRDLDREDDQNANKG